MDLDRQSGVRAGFAGAGILGFDCVAMGQVEVLPGRAYSDNEVQKGGRRSGNDHP